MAFNIKELAYGEVQKRAWEMFPVLFPDFRRAGKDYHSPLRIDGSEAKDRRKDKTVCEFAYYQRTGKIRVLENDESGRTASLWDLYMERNGIAGWSQAVREIAGKVGVSVPVAGGEGGSEEEFRRIEERREGLERIAEEAAAALRNSEEGRKVFDYLTKERGYPEEFVDWAGFGYVDGKIAQKIMGFCSYDVKFNKRIGKELAVCIPYRSTGGRIYGFVFRAIKEDSAHGERYYDVFFSESETKRYHLFGLRGLRLTGSAEERKEIVVVEGEFDALFCAYKGIRNVVAVSGSSGINPDSLKEAKAYGVERVTILFDTEESENGRAQTARKIARAVDVILDSGLAPFVCSLPSENGEKVDPDSFLKREGEDEFGEKINAVEELQSLIDAAVSGKVFQLRAAAEETGFGKGKKGTPSFKDLERFKRETVRICNSDHITASERDAVLYEFEERTGEYITAEALREDADRQREEAKKEEQKVRAKRLADEMQQLLREGKTEEALAAAEKAAEIKEMSNEAYYGALHASGFQTEEQIRDRWRNRPRGIETGYEFKPRGKKEKRFRLRIPNGALTFIGAQTSHGKSRFLQNLAIQFAKDGKVGDSLYFTFEEDREAVEMELFNIYADMELADNNLEALEEYGHTGSTEHFAKDADTEEFEEKRQGFFDLLKRGRIRVFYEDLDSDRLAGFVRHEKRRGNIGVVFVDYVQRLRKKGSKLLRKEELTELCDDLMKLSIETGLPIVLAAQLNREAKSPVDMAVQNISDAADIEHSASVVVLLWNSAVDPLQNNSYFYKVKKGKGDDKREVEEITKRASEIEGRGGLKQKTDSDIKREEEERTGKRGSKKDGRARQEEEGGIWDNGFKIGKEGYVYALVAKNRKGKRNADAVLRFKGNTGAILPEITEGDRVREAHADALRDFERISLGIFE